MTSCLLSVSTTFQMDHMETTHTHPTLAQLHHDPYTHPTPWIHLHLHIYLLVTVTGYVQKCACCANELGSHGPISYSTKHVSHH